MSNLNLLDEKARQQITHSLDKNYLVEAGAGSGKTTCLVARMISMITSSDAKVEEIVAITFTKKAADELKQRFQNKLELTLKNEACKISKDKLRAALENIDNCFIGTIHSFCSRLLRERPIEAGLDPTFQELDNTSEPLLMNEAWKEYLELIRTDHPELLRGIDEIGIKAEQLKECFAKLSNYTDVQINYDMVDKPDLLPSLNKLRSFINTYFEYIPKTEPEKGYDKLQGYLRTANNLIKHLNMSEELNIIKVLSPFAKEPTVTLNRWTDKLMAKEVKEEFTIFSQEIAPNLVKWKEHCYYFVLEFVQPAVKYYESLRCKRSLLNFQDLLIKAAETLKVHPEIRECFQAKYKYLLVDEYQDTDPIQAGIIFYLTGTDVVEQDWRKLCPKPSSLFVVGDPKQSIYRFRRADIGIYNLTKKLIEASGGETLSLTSNFRSLKSVCEVLNLTFKGILPKERDDYQAQYCTLEGVREDVCGTDFGVKFINIPAEFTKKDEVMAQDALSIAKYVKWAIDGNVKLAREDGTVSIATPKDFMIILRYKDQMDLYSRELENLGIPTAISGGSSFGSCPEITEIVKLLKAVGDTNNELFLVAVLRGMFFGISDDNLYKFKISGGRFSIYSEIPDCLAGYVKKCFLDAFKILNDFIQLKKKMPPAAMISKIVNDSGVIPFTLSCEMRYSRCSSIYQLLEMINKFEINGVFSFKDMVQNIEGILESKPENELSIEGENRDAVCIMNLHKAKGLEAPIVFLANPIKLSAPRVDMHSRRIGVMPEGYFCIKTSNGFLSEVIAQPVNWSTYEQEEIKYLTAEEDRLLYVAATRAKNLLIISSCDSSNKKNPWSRILDNLNSTDAIDLDNIPISTIKVAPLMIDNFELEKPNHMLFDANIFNPTFKQITPSAIDEQKVDIKSDYQDRFGATFGIIMHKLYEKLIKTKTVTDLDILQCLSEFDESAEKLPVIQSLLESFIESDIYKRILGSSKILCELPFSIKVSSSDDLLKDYKSVSDDVPVIVSGIIDLAFLEPDGWVILDYKTNSVKDDEEKMALANHYSAQIGLYCRAFERITSECVKSGMLCFVRGIKDSPSGCEIVVVS